MGVTVRDLTTLKVEQHNIVSLFEWFEKPWQQGSSSRSQEGGDPYPGPWILLLVVEHSCRDLANS